MNGIPDLKNGLPPGWWYAAAPGTPKPPDDVDLGTFARAWPSEWRIVAVDLSARWRIDNHRRVTLMLVEGEQSSRLACEIGNLPTALGYESGDFTMRAVFANVLPPDWMRNTEFLELTALAPPSGEIFSVKTAGTARIVTP